MPRYHHPAAVNDDLPTPPQAVTVGGDTVPVEADGTFTAASDAVVRPVADAYDMAVSDLRADSDAREPPDGETCDTVKADGDVCGRELPCPYHSE